MGALLGRGYQDDAGLSLVLMLAIGGLGVLAVRFGYLVVHYL